jgi:hypothetical protein
MIKNVLANLGGVGLYGILSVCLFFVVFLSTMLWTAFQRRSLMTAMSELPLDDGATKPETLENTRHE